MQKFTLNLSSSNDINAHLPNNHESEDINVTLPKKYIATTIYGPIQYMMK